ncbi:MAG: hypothetical protein MUO76_19995 [Anaerolineaceae bacterium]|nr:hypothetical protein [Anaerolineaceae bacterium]
MSQFIKLSCPSCGGTLETTISDDIFSCPYCHVEYLFQPDVTADTEDENLKTDPGDHRLREIVRQPLEKYSNFSDSTTWAEGSSKNYRAFLQDGFYHIIVLSRRWYRRQSCQGVSLHNFEVSVETEYVKGESEASSSGIAFRRTEAGLYIFYIAQNGHYAVWLRNDIDETWKSIIGWRYSTHIKQSRQKNLLSVKGWNDSFEFSVNNKLLTRISDDTFPDGEVGLCVETEGEDTIAEVRFSNFKLFVLE